MIKKRFSCLTLISEAPILQATRITQTHTNEQNNDTITQALLRWCQGEWVCINHVKRKTHMLELLELGIWHPMVCVNNRTGC